MGACCAPSYANLFLGWWEENVWVSETMFLTECDTVELLHRGCSLFLFRIFEEYQEFVKDLNTNM